ncbi:MAG: ABC transporter ATP-binding protein [Planctomycetaceae bacterium]|jgi:ABC-2 type transport system ATP-binding protein|nr:ABC transporter ATP-binding protein [Planctomycetaceae bacterium]
MSSAMIEALDLTKYYGEFAAIDNVSFSINKGEVAAFLGPNGAGKSTSMKLLTGYLSATRGTAKIVGHDMATDRIAGAAKLGYLPENGPLYPDMSPVSLLRFFGEARGIKGRKLDDRIAYVVELCALKTVYGKPIGKLSKGFRQRVGMAQALLHEPEVLILDEPTAGLDPNQIYDVRQTLKQIGKEKTILLSTHILQEVEAVASRVLFINEGKLIFNGTIDDFRKKDANLDNTFRSLTKSV